jgi:hypothetical protein
MRKGGELLGEGGFTCVFSPPLTCRGKPDLPAGKYVSRVVEGNISHPEVKIQEAVKQIIARKEAEHPGKVAKYFNLMVSWCDEFTIKPSDVSGTPCEQHTLLNKPGEIKKEDGFHNIITPRQHQPIVKHDYVKYRSLLTRSRPETARGFKQLMEALVYVGGAFIQNDAHSGNIAWMLDGRMVLFDWGMTVTTDTKKFVERNARMKKYYEEDPEEPYTATLAIVNGTEDQERLRVVWDILCLLDVMIRLNILPTKSIDVALNRIIALLREGVPKQEDLLNIIQELFRGSTGGRRTRRRRKVSRRR